jgi:hypothetical protein
MPDIVGYSVIPKSGLPVFGKGHAQTKNPDLDPFQLNWIKV